MLFVDEQYSTYFSVALRSYEKANHCKESLDIHLPKEPTTGDEFLFFQKMINKVERESLIGVVFLALTLEAFISDYAIRRMPPEYFEKRIKRLSSYEKWEKVPMFLARKKISENVLERIKKLISLRNEIAHSKSVIMKDIPSVDREDLVRKVNKIHDDKAIVTKHINEAMETVEKAVNELKQMDQTVNLDWFHEREYHNLFVSEKDELKVFFEAVWKECLKPR